MRRSRLTGKDIVVICFGAFITVFGIVCIMHGVDHAVIASVSGFLSGALSWYLRGRKKH